MKRPRTPTRSCLGPGEDTWPRFLADFRSGAADRVYRSTTRTLADVPPVRRDLIKRHLYLVPNSIVVSRGCPHVCDFCYKEAFFEGGRSFYTQTVDAALAEIERLPGRHLYFPRRPPVRRPPLCDGALRRDARHGPPLAGRRHRQRGARTRPARTSGGVRPPQPVCRLRVVVGGQPARAAQVPEPSTRLRRRHPAPARCSA